MKEHTALSWKDLIVPNRCIKSTQGFSESVGLAHKVWMASFKRCMDNRASKVMKANNKKNSKKYSNDSQQKNK